MNDEKLINEEIAEDIRADFYDFVAQHEWEDARECLKALEEMKVSTWKLRKDMNEAMAKIEELGKVDEEKWSNLQHDNGY